MGDIVNKDRKVVFGRNIRQAMRETVSDFEISLFLNHINL
jgi:hypothetical protein